MKPNQGTTPSEYYKTIDNCAENRKNLIISNGCAEHAAYLIKTLFKHAQKKVCIYTGELYDSVFGDKDLCSEALSFLGKEGTSLSIILEKNMPLSQLTQKELIREISATPSLKDSFKLSYAPSDVSNINHFAVMDGEAFRYELDHIAKQAIANFGDNRNGETLQQIFEGIQFVSTPISLAPQA